MIKEINSVSDHELEKLAEIYMQLSDPTDRNLWLMGGNLLLASQEARKRNHPPDGRQAS